MEKQIKQSSDCKLGDSGCCGGPQLEMLPMYEPPGTPGRDEPCCGPPAGPPSSPNERPGYTLCPFVSDFLETPAGKVPQVKGSLDRNDLLGTIKVRLGAGRSDYKVAPGLYAMGRPDNAAPVVVTANYKLTFDTVRRSLAGEHAWLLVLDTRGINVWCAAGKGTFGTDELIRRVKVTGLDLVVSHRRLVLPQLGATGVAAHKVRKGCGFEVVWGPVRAQDLKAFLASGDRDDGMMRRVTFTLKERLVLIPVEITLLSKYLLWTIAAIVLLSGVGPHIFSFGAAWHRGLLAATAVIAGIVAGCAVVPALLPWIPGRAFAVKGTITGAAVGLLLVIFLWAGGEIGFGSVVALLMLTSALSSFLAMNFTGSTPFTSPSGVEKEMRRAIPLQLATAVLAVVFWVGDAFL